MLGEGASLQILGPLKVRFVLELKGQLEDCVCFTYRTKVGKSLSR